jgi:rubrerythrin
MQDISLIKALSIARDIENGLIEKKFFEVFEGDPIELKQVLLNLAAATREHHNRIEKVWNNEIKF